MISSSALMQKTNIAIVPKTGYNNKNDYNML